MRNFIISAACCALAWSAANAQAAGVPEAGHDVATRICASCHAVLRGQGTLEKPPPLPFEEQVPLPFEEIANTPGITALSLFAWMTTSHPTMPDIVLPKDQLRDVVAYILSLKREH